MSAVSDDTLPIEKEVPNPNPIIGRNMKVDEHFVIRIGCWNIANAQRDEEKTPLKARLPAIIDQINDLVHPLDVLVLLEVGRHSQNTSWTRLAAQIEEETGLVYMGLHRPNASRNPLCKAFFQRSSTCMIVDSQHRWLDVNDTLVAGPGNGCDVTTLLIHPVVDYTLPMPRVIRDYMIKASFVHLPMGESDRLKCIDFLRNDTKSSVIMGDFNTFPDEGGPLMVQLMEFSDWTSLLPDDIVTFKAFPHDICTKPKEAEATLNPESKVVSRNEDGTIGIRFSSPLDKVFVSAEFSKSTYEIFGPNLKASDHALIVAHITPYGY